MSNKESLSDSNEHSSKTEGANPQTLLEAISSEVEALEALSSRMDAKYSKLDSLADRLEAEATHKGTKPH